MKRGEIWAVKVAAADGGLPKAAHPCVVLTPTELNEHLRTVIVAPLSTRAHAAPFRVPVTHAGKRGQIVLDQCQTVDKSCLTTRIGALSNTTLGKALTVLQELFAD